MILADTSVIVELLRGNLETGKIEKHGRIATCYPVESELYRGTRIARNTEKGEKQVEKLLQRTDRLEADQAAAKKFAELKEKYPEINELDLMIAGICISRDTKILTEDKDFTEIEELEVETI